MAPVGRLKFFTLRSVQANLLYFYNFISNYKHFQALFQAFWPLNDRHRKLRFAKLICFLVLIAFRP